MICLSMELRNIKSIVTTKKNKKKRLILHRLMIWIKDLSLVVPIKILKN